MVVTASDTFVIMKYSPAKSSKPIDEIDHYASTTNATLYAIKLITHATNVVNPKR